MRKLYRKIQSEIILTGYAYRTTTRVLLIGFMGFFISLSGFIRDARAQTPVPANTSPITMDVFPAYEGNYKYGEWLPIYIQLVNNGPDLQGEIRIPVQSSGGSVNYSALVELPAGARKLVTVYVLPNNFSRQLNAELYSGDDLLSSQRVVVQPNPNVNYFVGILSPQRGALSLISAIEIPGIERPKVLIDIPLAQLADRYEGLRSFDLIILNDTDTSTLSPEQKLALETWVNQGGRLVIGGGPGAEITTSGLPETLFPAEFVSNEPIDQIPSLEKLSGEDYPILVPGPFLMSKIQPYGGRALVSEGGNPLLFEWGIGDGFVNFIALNPAVSPFDAWNGATVFWQKLIAPGSAYPDYLPTDISARQQFASNMPYALSNLPVLDLPSARGLALMLAIYILLVGPANYLVLRRMKRLHLAWVTIPAITVIFSAASFGLGYAMHGTDIFVNKISLIQVAPTGSAQYDSYIGVFSPAQTAYQVEVSGSGLISPLLPYYDPWSSMSQSGNSGQSITLIQGDPAIVEGLSIDQWSMQSFVSEGSITQFGILQPDLVLQGDALVGTLTNSTDYTFEDAVVILGSKFVSLGELAPGEQTEVNLPLGDLGAPNFSSSLSYAMFETALNSNGSTPDRRKAESRRIIVENLFERTPAFVSSRKPSGSVLFSYQVPVFLGWIDQAPPEVRIVGAVPGEQTTSAVVFPLTYALPQGEIISIPVGLIPGELISSPLEGGTCGMPGTTAVYISRGDASFEFRIPNEISDFEAENLKLGLWSDSGVMGPLKAELYDWTRNEWIELTGLNQGVNLIPQASQFIHSDGLIQVRLGSENSQSCVYVALGSEGSQP